MTTSFLQSPIMLEPRDIAKMIKCNRNRCRKCVSELKEGDIVIRTGKHPTKYYHKNCFKQY
ncbi:MAG TPA: hypothetical protein VGR54_04150 [Nitrosopumilaceae archaeon]|nr:hypothetical protein [Nitrosopumilaceae archaeon]